MLRSVSFLRDNIRWCTEPLCDRSSQVYYYASNGQLQQLQQIQVPQFAGAYMTSNGQMAFPAGEFQRQSLGNGFLPLWSNKYQFRGEDFAQLAVTLL